MRYDYYINWENLMACLKDLPKKKLLDPDILLKQLNEYADDIYDLNGKSEGYTCVKACIDIVKNLL